MPNAMRSFDPRRVGRLECTAWVTYYRREWLKFLRAAVGLTRHTFALPWPATLRGAWLVLRANQLWAPYPGQRSRRGAALHGALLSPRGRPPRRELRRAQAARLEVEWWRVHRDLQRREAGDEAALADALAALYAHVYAVPAADVGLAARERALAMRHSDRWVQEGCDLASPLVHEEREALVRSYAALLAAVHRS